MENDNPFAAPSEISYDEIPPEDGKPLRIATSGKRFLNFVIDYVLTEILAFFFMFAYLIVRNEEEIGDWESIFLGIFLSLLYYIVTEFAWGKSPAKFLTRTRVVTMDGGKPRFGQIVGRSFARFLPFEPLSFLGGKGHPVGWHDSLSGTCVIMEN